MAIVLITGCGTLRGYEGEERSSDELSVIYSLLPLLGGGFSRNVIISEVDGMKVDVNYKKIEVLPGEHTIQVYLYFFLTYSNYSVITFDTRAGNNYIVDYRVVDGFIEYFVTEENSGIVVYDQAGLSNSSE